MSIKVMTWVWDHSRAKGSQHHVLLAIADCASDDGSNAFPSIAELVRKTRLSERAVQSSIKKLVALGELFVSPNGGPRGCNRYRVIMETPPQNPHPADSAPAPRAPRRIRTPQKATEPPADLAPGTVLEPSKKISSSKRSSAANDGEETLGQRVNRLARTYTDRVKLSNFNAVAGVVRKAAGAGVSDDLIVSGLSQLADDGRSVTVDSLRYAIYGVPPSRAPGTAVALRDQEPKQSTGAQRAQAGVDIANRLRQQREEAERDTR